MDRAWRVAEPESRITRDGSLRVDQPVGSIDWHGEIVHDRWVAISDARTGQSIVDCRNWPRSRAVLRDDGTIHLRLSLAVVGSDTVYAIDPVRGSFRDLGINGTERSLSEMQGAIDAWQPEFTSWLYGSGWESHQRHIAPDGSMRIDESIVDNDRMEYLRSARAYDTATGAMILELDETQTWSKLRSWEAENLATLWVRRLGGFETFQIALSAAQGTWRLDKEAETPIRGEMSRELIAKVDAAELAARRKFERRPSETVKRLERLAILVFGVLCGGALVALYDAAFGPLLQGMGL